MKKKYKRIDAVINNAAMVSENMKNNNVKIIFLSNAPRPNYVVEEGLTTKLGLDKELYERIVTSGDVTIDQINKKILIFKLYL